MRVPLLLLLGLVALCNGAFNFSMSAPKRIYTNPTDGSVIKAFGNAMTTCSASLVILDTSSKCVKLLNGEGKVFSATCTPEMAGATDVTAFASGAYLYNSSGAVSIVSMYDGSLMEFIGPDQTSSPQLQKIGLFSSYNVPTLTHTSTYANGVLNTTFYSNGWTIVNSTYSTYSSSRLIQLGNQTPLKCMFGSTGSVFTVVFQNDSNVYQYSSSGNIVLKLTFGGPGVLGDIGACGGDFYGRMFFWDKTSNSLKVFDTTGTLIYQTPLPDVNNNVKSIWPARDHIFIHDGSGIMRYNVPPLQTTFVAPTNPTCGSSKVPVTIRISGGAPPYYMRVFPMGVNNMQTQVTPYPLEMNWSTTVSPQPFFSTTQKYYIYQENIAPEYSEINPGTGSYPQTPASVFPPYQGSYSWGMLMANNNNFGVNINTALGGSSARIPSNYFSTLEMMVNPGNGLAGGFRIDLTYNLLAWYYFDYYPKDLPNNTWTKISIDLSMAPIQTFDKYSTQAYFTHITFVDLSYSASTTSYLYVDNIVLIPYNTSQWWYGVQDFCNVTAYSPYYNIDASQQLAVNVTSTSTSCNPIGSYGDKASDGSLTAVVTGGIPPYNYSWGFSSSNTSTVTGLPPMNANVIIYDNFVNPLFQDVSTTAAYNPSATLYVHSPLFSISFTPSSSAVLQWYIPTGLNSSQYSAIEFWVNGGPTGGQVIYAALSSSLYGTINQSLIHKLMSLPAIPANVWIKVTLPIPSNTGTFFGFVISSFAGIDQPVIYFDDIKILSNTYNFTVTDNSTCKVFTNYISVPAPGVLVATPTVNNMQCYNQQNGKINLVVSGGTAPYSFSWTSPSSTQPSISNLADGTYTVAVTDSNTCLTSPQVTAIRVLRPPQLVINSTVVQPLCYNKLGRISLQVAGGVPNYIFSLTGPSNAQWSAPTPIFSDMLQQNWVFDSQTNATVVCNGVNRVNASLSSLYGYCSISVNPSSTATDLFGVTCATSGCIPAATYSAIKFWINLFDTSIANSLSAVFVSGGQPYTTPLTIAKSAGWQQVVVNINTNTDRTFDSFYIALNGTAAKPFALDDIVLMSSTTTLGTSTPSISSGFDAEIDAAGGSYIFVVNDLNGCPVNQTFMINVPTAIALVGDQNGYQTPSTSDGTDGIVWVNVTGGTPPYTYAWSSGETTNAIYGVAAGKYEVTIGDNNGCSAVFTASVPSYSNIGGVTIRAWSSSVAVGFGVIVGVGGLVALLSILILTFKWSAFTTYGPFYCAIINLGCVIAYAAAVVVLPKPTDALCLAFPWLLGIAFNLVYGCLFIKTFTLYRVFFKASQMKRANLTPFYILKVLSVFVGIEVAFMLIWTFVSPPKAGYASLLNGDKELQCTNDTPAFWIVFLSIKGAWMIFGAVIGFLSRNIAKEYNESKSIAYAIYNDIVLIIIAVPLALTLKEVPSGVVVVEAAVTVLSFTFTLLLLFFPVWWQIFFSKSDLVPMKITFGAAKNGSGGSGGNTSSTGNSHSPTHSDNTSNREVYNI